MEFLFEFFRYFVMVLLLDAFVEGGEEILTETLAEGGLLFWDAELQDFGDCVSGAGGDQVLEEHMEEESNGSLGDAERLLFVVWVEVYHLQEM